MNKIRLTGTFPAVAFISASDMKDARRHVVSFCFQLEFSRQLLFPENELSVYLEQFQVPTHLHDYVRAMISGIVANWEHIDEVITEHAQNWKLSRMGKVDLAILRVGVFELFARRDLPSKIILSDAAEIGKSYGSEHSGSFVNGLLDAVAKTFHSQS